MSWTSKSNSIGRESNPPAHFPKINQMDLHSILALGIRFLEVGCDEQAVAEAVANQIMDSYPTREEAQVETEIEFVS